MVPLLMATTLHLPLRTVVAFTLLRGVIKNGKAKPTPGNNGVVLTTGAGAKFVMAGGTIQDSTVANALGGAVTVVNGATGELRGGTIQNTTLTNQYSGSVMLKMQISP